MHKLIRRWLYFVAIITLSPSAPAQQAWQQPWQRHVIDDSLRGADGVRLSDADGDGLLDIATGWEESGTTRIYLNPGPKAAYEAWPSVTVGPAPAVEDAVWVDLNRDGRLDVLSSCEGSERNLRVHYAPNNSAELLRQAAWQTEVIPAAQKVTRWMYALPVPTAISPDFVVVGSKSPAGMIGLLHVSKSGRAAEHRLQKLCDAAWIMSIESHDIDGDGDDDIVYSDRKGEQAGVYWLERPSDPSGRWSRHLIGALGREVMFLVSDRPDRGPRSQAGSAKQPSNEHASIQIVVVAKPNDVIQLRPGKDVRARWDEQVTSLPANGKIGTAKSIAILPSTSGQPREFIYSCEQATDGRSGVVRFGLSVEPLQVDSVSGPDGIKFDLLQLQDLDGDKDLDVLTCEERYGGRGLGIIWYENPDRNAP